MNWWGWCVYLTSEETVTPPNRVAQCTWECSDYVSQQGPPYPNITTEICMLLWSTLLLSMGRTRTLHMYTHNVHAIVTELWNVAHELIYVLDIVHAQSCTKSCEFTCSVSVIRLPYRRVAFHQCVASCAPPTCTAPWRASAGVGNRSSGRCTLSSGLQYACCWHVLPVRPAKGGAETKQFPVNSTQQTWSKTGDCHRYYYRLSFPPAHPDELKINVVTSCNLVSHSRDLLGYAFEQPPPLAQAPKIQASAPSPGDKAPLRNECLAV